MVVNSGKNIIYEDQDEINLVTIRIIVKPEDQRRHDFASSSDVRGNVSNILSRKPSANVSI